MAGRPLRRAREAAKQNPLVGFIDEHTLGPKQILEPLAPLLHPKTAEKLEQAFKRVVPNILVYFGPEPAQGVEQWNRARALAKQHNATLLWVNEYEKTTPFYAELDNQRGSSERITPFTAFTLLHRLGDEILAQIEANEGDGPDRYWEELKEEVLADLRKKIFFGEQAHLSKKEKQIEWIAAIKEMQKGVDTAAGRLGVLTDATQILADLFAKYLLTGRIAYNPPETDDPGLARFYKSVKAMLPEAMERMMSYVVPGALYVLY